jgi:hypothetical protein
MEPAEPHIGHICILRSCPFALRSAYHCAILQGIPAIIVHVLGNIKTRPDMFIRMMFPLHCVCMLRSTRCLQLPFVPSPVISSATSARAPSLVCHSQLEGPTAVIFIGPSECQCRRDIGVTVCEVTKYIHWNIFGQTISFGRILPAHVTYTTSLGLQE